MNEAQAPTSSEGHSNPDSTPISFIGSVERVTFHSEESGYCVLRLKIKGQRDLATVVGYTNSVAPGEDLECIGIWTSHRDFGLQFKAQSIRSIQPNTLEGIEKYLGSGMLKGIGPSFAKKMVDKFRTQIFEIIENEPHRLLEISGMGRARVKLITTTWTEQKIVREILVFLQSHGVSTSKSFRIYRTYGNQAISRVKENPYQLAKDIQGIGFKSADQIAQNLGVSKTSLIRARAGIHYVLFERIGSGHCAYPEDTLVRKAIELLETEEAIVREAIELEVQDRELFRETIRSISCLYPSSLFHAEREVARLLSELAQGPVPWGKTDPSQGIPWVEKNLNIQLAHLQKQAVEMALSTKTLIITGGPGTGKTTLTRSIVRLLESKSIQILLCSPTGRAAKRLSECTKREAKTIHRMLGVDPITQRFLHDEENLLPADLIIIDEASMIDITLMQHLLRAIPSRAAVILVGDVDQIPSVGPGAVLQSLIQTGKIPTLKLTQVFRQAAESEIIQSAHQINAGQMPMMKRRDKKSDFHFIPSADSAQTTAKIIDLVKNRIPQAYGLDPIRDIQVLCPMNLGSLGCRSLNVELQKALNPNPRGSIEKFGTLFAPGDKVIITANDYEKEVFNGDIGVIDSIRSEHQDVLIHLDERKVAIPYSEMDLLSLAYAITIHKAQGSEYPAVVIPVMMQHSIMLKKNLIYTALTRGKKLVVLVGQEKALQLAVGSKNQDERWTNLASCVIEQWKTSVFTA